MSGLIGELDKLLLEILAVGSAIVGVVLLLRRLGERRFEARLVAAVVLGTATLVAALANVRSAGSVRVCESDLGV